MKINLGIAVMVASLASSTVFAQQVIVPRGERRMESRNGQNMIVEKASSGGYLGIGGLDISPERAKALNLKEERGVEVSSLAAEGPAAKAGLKEGDVVLEFNGQHVEGTTQFQRLVRETPVGRNAKITVWRSGATQTLTAVVGENKQQTTTMVMPGDGQWNFSMPDMPAMPNIEIPRFNMSSQNPMLGIVGESLGQEDQLAEYFGVPDGVLVRSVRKGSAAEKAGIKAGDVITKVDDSKVTSSTEITRVLRNAKAKKTITVYITRNKHEMPLTVTVEATTGPGTIRAE